MWMWVRVWLWSGCGLCVCGFCVWFLCMVCAYGMSNFLNLNVNLIFEFFKKKKTCDSVG